MYTTQSPGSVLQPSGVLIMINVSMVNIGTRGLGSSISSQLPCIDQMEGSPASFYELLKIFLIASGFR